MAGERGLERLTFFTDAIVAIAITLLVLPLVDRVAEGGASTPVEWMHENFWSVAAFLLSFAVTARFWMVHHELFAHVTRWTPLLRWLSLAWAFTIVFFSVPSAMLTVWPSTTLVAGLYVGTMLATCALSAAMIFLIRGSSVEDPEYPVTGLMLRGSVVTVIEFVVAFALSLVPAITFDALFVLLSSVVLSPLFHLYDRRRARA
jgi:uncharacterized membrane protein